MRLAKSHRCPWGAGESEVRVPAAWVIHFAAPNRGNRLPAGWSVAQPIRRVAICTYGELFGGVERHVLAMLEGLVARNVSTLVVLFRDGELAAQARAMGISPVVISARNVALPLTTRRLAGIFKESRIQLVHAHGYKAVVYCALARRWHRFAMVKTEHGLPESMAQGLASTLRNRFYCWMDGLATQATRATVCYVAQDVRKYYAAAHAGLPACVIPNGVRALDRCRLSRPAELLEKDFNLLIVGRLDPVKGHDVAIKALATGALAGNVRLSIVGTGPCESELLVLARRLGVADRVQMLGFRRNALDYIAHCDVLLMPSLHEGVPYVLLEAMALGVPVVASRVGGLAEIIENDATGLLVPPQNVQALAQAIQRMHADEGLRVRTGRSAQALQAARYSVDAMTSRYVQVYEELLA